MAPRKPKPAAANKKPAGAYEVGYKKPPVHSRFQPGQPSPNKEGRRKKANSLAMIVKEEFDESHTVRGDDGRKTRMSALRVMVKQLRRDALKGDRAARKDALQLIQNLAGAAGGEVLTQAQMVARAAEEAEREALQAKLHASIVRFIDFVKGGKKAGLMDFDKDGNPCFTRAATLLSNYVAGRANRPAEDDATARAALEAFLKNLDQVRAERRGISPHAP